MGTKRTEEGSTKFLGERRDKGEARATDELKLNRGKAKETI